MPRTSARQSVSKFQRYHASKRARGMRLLRIWVLDLRAPGFVKEAERQAKLLDNKPEQIRRPTSSCRRLRGRASELRRYVAPPPRYRASRRRHPAESDASDRQHPSHAGDKRARSAHALLYDYPACSYKEATRRFPPWRPKRPSEPGLTAAHQKAGRARSHRHGAYRVRRHPHVACAGCRRLPFDSKVPNADTARTSRKADKGIDLTRSKDAADLFRKLGI
jgi:hypothetical protein